MLFDEVGEYGIGVEEILSRQRTHFLFDCSFLRIIRWMTANVKMIYIFHNMCKTAPTVNIITAKLSTFSISIKIELSLQQPPQRAKKCAWKLNELTTLWWSVFIIHLCLCCYTFWWIFHKFIYSIIYHPVPFGMIYELFFTFWLERGHGILRRQRWTTSNEATAKYDWFSDVVYVGNDTANSRCHFLF